MRTRGFIILLMLCSIALQVSAKPASEVIHRGDKFSVETIVSLDEVLSDPNKFADKQVRVTGTVKKVCLKKGCWLVLAGKAQNTRARVTFKDYAFFAPMDSAGWAASVEGLVKAKTLSEAERAHLASDGKVDVKEIPKAEIRIVASAASFVKPSSK